MTGVAGTPPAVLPFDWGQAALAAGRKSGPEDIRAAAAEFEALLVGQMLRSMREAGGGGWLGASDRDAAFSLMEMAEQCLATALAAQGGLGLARLIEPALTAQSGKSIFPENGHRPDSDAPNAGSTA